MVNGQRHKYFNLLLEQKMELTEIAIQQGFSVHGNLYRRYLQKLSSISVKMLVVEEKNNFIIEQLKHVV